MIENTRSVETNLDQHLESLFKRLRKRVDGRSLRRKPFTLALLALSLVLLVGVVRLPGQLMRLIEQWPLIRLWDEPQAQYRLALEDTPYELLREVDTLLPREEPLLLVTSGRDVRHTEYVTYHRALYFLTPRPVWWLSPAPSDGTWEARWWIAAPATATAVHNQAAKRGIACVLLIDVTVPGISGRRLAQWDRAALWQLDGREATCQAPATAAPALAYPSPQWPLRLAASLLVIVTLGYGVIGVARRYRYAVGGLAALGPAWLLGTGVLATGIFWLNAVGLRLQSQIAVLLILAVGVGLLHLWNLRGDDDGGRLKDVAPPLRLTALNLLLLTYLFSQLSYVLLMAAGRPLLVWDSWVNWAMKARTIFREGALTAAVYADPSRTVALLDYPLSVPLVEAWIYGWLGAPDDRLVGVLFFLFYAAMVSIVYTTVKEWSGSPRFALLAAAAMAAVGQLSDLAAMAFPDVIVAALATLAAVSLLSWLEGRAPGKLLVGALAAGLMPWTKQEGFVLLAALSLAMLLAAGWRKRRMWLALTACAFLAAVVAGPWAWFAAQNSVTADTFLPLTPITFFNNLGRLPVIAGRISLYLLASRTNYLWLIALLLVFWQWRTGNRLRRASSLLPLTAALYLGSMALAYTFSDFVPYQQHVVSSAWRLVSHVTPLLAFWIARTGLEPDLAQGQDLRDPPSL